MDDRELQTLLASVTPERVRQLVLELEPRQPKVARGTVPLFELLEALTEGLSLADAAEGSRADMHLRKAVIAAASQIEGMTFVEGDG